MMMPSSPRPVQSVPIERLQNDKTVYAFANQTTCTARPSFRYNDPRFVFVFTVTFTPGRDYHMKGHFKCTAAVESLVTIGGWAGAILILISPQEKGHPRCFDQQRLRKLTDNEHIYIVEVPILGKTARGKVHNMRGKPGMFEFAADLFHNDPVLSKVEVAIFHDCDVIWAKPGCVYDNMARSGIDAVEALGFGPDKTLIHTGGPYIEGCANKEEKGEKMQMEDVQKMLKFKPASVSEFWIGDATLAKDWNRRFPCSRNIHPGKMIAHRKWSNFTLSNWGKEMDRCKDPKGCGFGNYKDYDSLCRVMHYYPKLVRVWPPPSQEWGEHMFNPQFPGCSNHLTYFGRCRAWGHVAARRFLDALCLNELRPPASSIMCGGPGDHKEIMSRCQALA